MTLKYIHSESGTSYVEIIAFGSSMPVCLAKRLEDGRFMCVINNSNESSFSATADTKARTFQTEAEMLEYIKQQIEI